MTHKDISQIDTVANSHPDKADSCLTSRTKGDLHATNTALSFDEKTKKKRRHDPNKHYITGMFCIQHPTHTHPHKHPSKPLCHKCCKDKMFAIKIDFASMLCFQCTASSSSTTPHRFVAHFFTEGNTVFISLFFLCCVVLCSVLRFFIDPLCCCHRHCLSSRSILYFSNQSICR